VKKVFIRSGIRYDYLLADPDRSFFRQLVTRHVSGQLKVAPEHCAAATLAAMGKPSISVYEAFKKEYFRLSREAGLEQYLVPYLMSSHPGAGLREAVELALFLKKEGYMPEQVQDFYPTPGTVSTVMYATGLDPLTGKKVYVAKDYHEKQLQRALLQYSRPQNADLVREALRLAGREDLIGMGKECLVRPERPTASPTYGKKRPGQKGGGVQYNGHRPSGRPAQQEPRGKGKAAPKTAARPSSTAPKKPAARPPAAQAKAAKKARTKKKIGNK
jgi:hypothetical protein